MDDLLGVGEGQAVEDLLHDGELLIQSRQGLVGDQILEVCALEQLHGDVDLPVLLPEIIDGDDVGVIESGRGLSLPMEPLPSSASAPRLAEMVLMATSRSRTGS